MYTLLTGFWEYGAGLEFLNKLNPYHLFNYIVPGVVFCVGLEQIWELNFWRDNILQLVIVSYVVGLLVSRVGSLIVEPILKRIGFVKFSDYADFVKAEKEDNKIQELLETANLYRSLLGGLVSFVAISLGLWAISAGCVHPNIIKFGLVVAIFLLVLVGYRKQVSFIKKRVEFGKAKNGDS